LQRHGVLFLLQQSLKQIEHAGLPFEPLSFPLARFQGGLPLFEHRLEIHLSVHVQAGSAGRLLLQQGFPPLT
jgi:hypothetical protein